MKKNSNNLIISDGKLVGKFEDLYNNFADPWEQADKINRAMGFIQNVDSIILPNYFEPLEIRNVEVDFAYKSNSKSGSLSIFRGDSDQDRPNL